MVERRWRPWGWTALGAAVLVAAAGVVAALLWSQRPHIAQEKMRGAIIAGLQREAAAAFLVTGTLDVTATATVQNTKLLLPGLLDLPVGTTSATVRLPGRASYGFDVGRLRPSMIRVVGDTLVEVQIPELSVHSVEPDLRRLEVRTRVGWTRLGDDSRERVERRALGNVQAALRAQAEAYLRSAAQPRVNTAAALARILTPVLEAAGMSRPRLRFPLGGGVTVTPRG